jgi:hypothetical protein
MIQFGLAWTLCRVAEGLRPDMDNVWSIVQATVPNVHEFEDAYDYTALYGRAAEVCCQEQLRMAAMAVPDMVEMIHIPDGYETINYRFNDIKGNTTVTSKETGKPITDIDGLLAIAEGDDRIGRKKWHPFLVEVKMSPYTYGGDDEEMGEFKAYPSCLASLFVKPHRISGIKPVLSYFRDLYTKGEIPNKPEGIGVIVAMPNDQFNSTISRAQKRYEAEGGNILRLSFSLDSYGQWIYAMADRYNLKLAHFNMA